MTLSIKCAAIVKRLAHSLSNLWLSKCRADVEQQLNRLASSGTRRFAGTTLIDGTEFIDAKMAAMAAHPTQIELDGPFFALSNNLGNQVWGHEYYTLVKGEKSSNLDSHGREVDLFV